MARGIRDAAAVSARARDTKPEIAGELRPRRAQSARGHRAPDGKFAPRARSADALHYAPCAAHAAGCVQGPVAQPETQTAARPARLFPRSLRRTGGSSLGPPSAEFELTSARTHAVEINRLRRAMRLGSVSVMRPAPLPGRNGANDPARARVGNTACAPGGARSCSRGPLPPAKTGGARAGAARARTGPEPALPQGVTGAAPSVGETAVGSGDAGGAAAGGADSQ